MMRMQPCARVHSMHSDIELLMLVQQHQEPHELFSEAAVQSAAAAVPAPGRRWF